MSRAYFGTDGVRGRAGEGHITPEFIMKLGWAVGRVLGNEQSSVLIGKDTRISGYMFESALESGLAAAGCNVLLTGPMPTPGVAYLTRTFHAAAGVVISASHNAFHDNGIKFFSASGSKLADDTELLIEKELDKDHMQMVSAEKIGRAKRIDTAAARYIEFCKASIPMDISLKGLKIVVDCANGAAYHITPDVLHELGADVIKIGCEPDGLNINEGVGSTHPQALQQKVVEEVADLGIALDGDADRVLLVDEQGKILDGDDVLYIIALSNGLKERTYNSVVGTLMTNYGLELALNKQGIGLERAPVGDRYVLNHMLQNGGVLGGEPSGHVICLDKTTTGDGTIAGLQVIAEMVRQEKNLSELCRPVQKYPQKMINVKLASANITGLLLQPDVTNRVAEVERELKDDGRVVLRPSGTEPLIRVMVEGKDKTQVDSLCQNLADTIESLQPSLKTA